MDGRTFFNDHLITFSFCFNFLYMLAQPVNRINFFTLEAALMLRSYPSPITHYPLPIPIRSKKVNPVTQKNPTTVLRQCFLYNGVQNTVQCIFIKKMTHPEQIKFRWVKFMGKMGIGDQSRFHNHIRFN